jgi:hypothetical protein
MAWDRTAGTRGQSLGSCGQRWPRRRVRPVRHPGAGPCSWCRLGPGLSAATGVKLGRSHSQDAIRRGYLPRRPGGGSGTASTTCSAPVHRQDSLLEGGRRSHELRPPRHRGPSARRRLDRDVLGELPRRYATAVLIAADWTEQSVTDAEQRTVHAFFCLCKRPEAYTPGTDSTGSHLLGSALHVAAEPAVRPLAVRLAELEGRTYHDVAEVLARPNRHVAVVIREQVGALRDGDQTLR